MAYAAVISLKQTIEHILGSCRILAVGNSRRALRSLLSDGLTPLRDVIANKSLSVYWQEKLIEGASQLEDVLESRLAQEFLNQYTSLGGDTHPLMFNVTTLKDFDSFLSVIESVSFSEEEESDDDDDGDAVVYTDLGETDMVGSAFDELAKLKRHVVKGMRPDEFGVFSVVGTEGSCRTVIASAVFEDLYYCQEQSFDCGAWVTIGPTYSLKQVYLTILSQVDQTEAWQELLIDDDDDEEKLGEYLDAILKGRRYMIVLDDVRNIQTLHDIWGLLIRKGQNNGSLVLLTTTSKEVAIFAKSFDIYELPLLTRDNCWDVIRITMFGWGESCHTEFEEAGKKIAENCRGLKMLLAKALLCLLDAEKTPECWMKLAADQQNSIFNIRHHEISQICEIKRDMLRCSEGGLTIELISYLIDVSHMTKNIKMRMFPERFFPKMEITTITGMAGIGKTTFANKFFGDASVMSCFNNRAWVTLGMKYQTDDIIVDILTEIYPDIDKLHLKGDRVLVKNLCTKLAQNRCLIVLDDVWSKEPLHYLKEFFSEIKGEILVTTRLLDFAQFGDCDQVLEIGLLNEDESWCLLCQKVFAQGSCPAELEEAGKKIAYNCDGLPLTIVKVSRLLSEVERSQKYWNQVAEKKDSIFKNVHKEISKAIFPSYKIIFEHLKACFLYMGVFPEKYEISRSKLIRLWIVEGFLEPNLSQSAEDFATECLFELVNRSLVIVCQKGSNSKLKTCRLQSIFWHLSNREAMKHKFFHAYIDSSVDSVINQRRFCIRSNILLGFKDVYNSIASNSCMRSLLCTGPPHQYQVPIYLSSRLLRVVDAHSIRFYEFPNEALILIHLRYLALTYNGELPASICQLWFLQCLIIRRYLIIKLFKHLSYLPVGIWKMKELKHLQITGSILPNPNRDALLPNLQSLVDVNPRSCTKEVFSGIPNLKIFGIQIELAPGDNDDGKHFQWLNLLGSQ